MSTVIVRASEPTVLPDKTHYELLSTSLMLGFRVDTSHIVPDIIDFERFRAALADTLAVYPLAAGRLERPRDVSQQWKVRLSNEGVPVTIVESPAEQEVAISTVVQNPWTLTQGVDIARQFDYGSQEPLLKITLTKFTKIGSTSIGCSSAHVIGDGYTVMKFIELLSQNYQGLSSPKVGPSYEPIPLCQDNRHVGHISTVNLDYSYSVCKGPPFLDPSRKKPLRVDLRLKENQIAQINKTVLKRAREKYGVDGVGVLSRQDTLIGLLAVCISRADPLSPVLRISNIFMSRGIAPRPHNAACNSLIWAVSDDVEDPYSIYSVGCSVRKAVIRARNPAYGIAFDFVQGPIMADQANNGLCQDFTPPPGYIVVNSTWKFDWTSAHFGYPGRTRFYHTIHDEPRYIKIFQPNPTRLPNGDWESHPGDAEVTFHLHGEANVAFRQALSEELRVLDVEEDVEFVTS